jgi:hypothetical protein
LCANTIGLQQAHNKKSNARNDEQTGHVRQQLELPSGSRSSCTSFSADGRSIDGRLFDYRD